MDSRADRCACMHKQLSNIPSTLNHLVRIHRQKAAGPSDCPSILKKGIRHPAMFAVPERSLWCSNYLIWEKASRSDADYIVIIEDDALMLPGAWERLASFLLSPCKFDYVVVDPVFPGSWDPNIEVAVPEKAQPVDKCPGGFQGSKPGLLWSCTHFTIIRKRFVDTLLSKSPEWGWGAMDDWWQTYLRDPYTAFGWKGGLAIQASVGQLRKVSELLNHTGCSNETMESSIGLGKVSRLRRAASSSPQLVCPKS